MHMFTIFPEIYVASSCLKQLPLNFIFFLAVVKSTYDIKGAGILLGLEGGIIL